MDVKPPSVEMPGADTLWAPSLRRLPGILSPSKLAGNILLKNVGLPAHPVMASPRPSTALRQLQSCASASVLGVANFRVVRLTAASAAYRRHASTSVFIKIASYNVRLDFRLPPFASVFQGTKSPEKSMVLAGHANSSSHSPFGLSLSAAAEEDDPMRWDGLLNAVPKKKVSHSRKSMRSANKGLKDRVGQ